VCGPFEGGGGAAQYHVCVSGVFVTLRIFHTVIYKLVAYHTLIYKLVVLACHTLI